MLPDDPNARVLVQVRVPAEHASELREAGKVAGRTLPAEVQHRLERYREGSMQSSDDHVITWAVSALAKNICSQVELFHDPATDRAAFLGLVKAAFDEIMNELGASGEVDKTTATAITAWISLALKRSQINEHPAWRWEHIRNALKPAAAPIAKVRQAKPTAKPAAKKGRSK